LYNAALLTECGQIDSRAKELILVVKRWAKDRGICHAAKGHLPPYTWGLLTMYFLQVGVSEEGPLLPPLEEFQMSAGLLAKPKNDKSQTATKWKPAENVEPKKSVGGLFKEFVHFFETQFDWQKEAVSIRAGKRAPPSLDLPLHIIDDGSAPSRVGPSIEDPFHTAQNLADGMTNASYARLKEELSRAESLCQGGGSLSELLEPWVPPDFESGDRNHDEHSNGGGEMPPPTVSCKPAAKKVPQAAAKGEDWRRDAMEAQRSALPPWRQPSAKASTRVAGSTVA